MKDPGLDEELCNALSVSEDDWLCIYCQAYPAAKDSEYCSASCAAMAERENEEET